MEPGHGGVLLEDVGQNLPSRPQLGAWGTLGIHKEDVGSMTTCVAPDPVLVHFVRFGREVLLGQPFGVAQQAWPTDKSDFFMVLVHRNDRMRNVGDVAGVKRM